MVQTEKRKIIHIDMDAFFASVEQLDDPSLKGKAIAVGGSKERGVVAAASYEARRFGVKSAMSSIQAAKLCPHLIFVKPRFDRYVEISKKIRKIFYRYTYKIEPLSLDEAFLDVSENKLNLPSATLIAIDIKRAIKEELNLNASAGVSFNKFLSKVASDEDKPNGLFVIDEKNAHDFLMNLPIKRFFGIGKVTAEKMLSLNIPNGRALYQKERHFLEQHFGKAGSFYYNVVRGIDNRDVIVERKRKSVGVERTFFSLLKNEKEILSEIALLYPKLYLRLNDEKAFTLTLKIKFADFKQITRSISTEKPLSKAMIEEITPRLLKEVLPLEQIVRLIGIQCSNFKENEIIEQEVQTKFDF